MIGTGTSDTTIAVCKCGGVVIAAVTAYIDQKCKNALMKAVMDGCSLQHVTSRDVREVLPFGCKCGKAP